MSTVNYFQVVDSKQSATKRKMRNTGRAKEVARIAYEGLPTHRTKANI